MASSGVRVQLTPPHHTGREVAALRSRILLLSLFAAGCGADIAGEPVPSESLAPAIGTAFDAARSGLITGRVRWQGNIPDPPGFLFAVPQPDGRTLDYRTAANPNRPSVHPKSLAVAGAVVFLRGIEPAVAKPWNLPAVRVEMGAGRIDVIQGERRGRVGFVRRGEAITIGSAEPVYHILRGRGEAFFSIPLPEPHRPVTRTLPTSGRVELTSGTGLYWASADLFVADHPYYAVTDAAGHFAFDHVPAGPVEVVVWLPGWEVARQDRDPDSTAITRMTYSAAVERASRVTVAPGRRAEITFTVP
jgi:hypothetical protein